MNPKYLSPLLHRARVGVSGAVLVLSRSASAESEPHADVALRGGPVSSTGFSVAAGALVEGEVGYRLTQAWRTEAYLGWTTVQSTASVNGSQHFEAVRFGARGTWHARAGELLDPWAGVSFGGFCTTGTVPGRWAAEVGFDVGLDVRIAPTVVIGPVFALIIPLGNGQLHSWTTPVGSYFSGIPLNIPLPFLRVAVAL